jgi:hypothetical protein
MNYYNYFTEVEEHFVRRRGKHLFVSPMDWSLIAAWRESGVPLHVALRGIDIAMDTWHSKQKRISDKLSSLFYCHDAVMAEYARHLEAHLGENKDQPDAGTAENTGTGTAAGIDKKALLTLLEARISEIKAVREKLYSGTDSSELDRILSRLDEIAGSARQESRPVSEELDRDLEILTGVLVAELVRRVPPEEMEAWDQEAKKELKLYKKRLDKEMYKKIHDNYIRAKVHRRFGLGELSLFNL